MAYAAAAMATYQVVAGLQASEMMKQEGEFNERLALINSQYVEQDAWEAEQFGYSRMGRYKAQEDQVLGEQMTAFAAQGIDFTFGTAAAVIEESKFNAYLNTLDIQKEARGEALGLKIQAGNIRLGGQRQASQARTNAATARGRAIVGAAGSIASYYAGRA